MKEKIIEEKCLVLTKGKNIKKICCEDKTYRMMAVLVVNKSNGDLVVGVEELNSQIVIRSYSQEGNQKLIRSLKTMYCLDNCLLEISSVNKKIPPGLIKRCWRTAGSKNFEIAIDKNEIDLVNKSLIKNGFSVDQDELQEYLELVKNTKRGFLKIIQDFFSGR